jgi:hypothetical protein
MKGGPQSSRERERGGHAQVAAFRGTLVRGGADQVGELGLDQSLVDGFGCGTDPVADIATLSASGTPSRPGAYTTGGDMISR